MTQSGKDAVITFSVLFGATLLFAGVFYLLFILSEPRDFYLSGTLGLVIGGFLVSLYSAFRAWVE